MILETGSSARTVWMYTIGFSLQTTKTVRSRFRAPTDHRCRGNTILAFLLRFSYSGLPPVSLHPLRLYHQQENSQPTTKLCFGVCETRIARGHENRRGVVRGMMQQAPPKSLSTAVATPRMFTHKPSMWDSLASPMVAAGTVGAGAEI